MSPLDWCLIELWRDSGIPLHVALRGIDRSFESVLKRQKKVPRSLFYCHPAVIEAFEEYKRAMVGVQDGPPHSRQEVLPKRVVLEYLEQLKKSVEQHQDEALQRAAGRLSHLQSEVAVRESNDSQQIDQDLARIGTMVVDSLRNRLSTEEREELKDQVKKEIRIYKRRLSREMYTRLEMNYFNRKVRERHHLPEFSLLGLTGEGEGSSQNLDSSIE